MKTRIKMRQMPGDVSKHTKIAMMEEKGKKPDPLLTHPVHPLVGKPAKTFRKMIRSRERAVLRERAKKEIKKEQCEPVKE